MGVEILKREYTNIFRPQDTNINWLIGNVGVWQRLNLEVSFGVYVDFDTTNTLFLDDPDTMILTNGKSWNEYGFAEGDSIVIEWIYRDLSNPSTPVDYPNRVPALGNQIFIDRIEDNKAYIVDSTGTPITTFGSGYSNILPVQRGDFALVDVIVYTQKRPQGIKFTYGHLDNANSQSNNLSSFIDGTFTSFLKEDTDLIAVNSKVAMLPIGNQSGMSISHCNVKYLGSRNFGIEHIYEIEVFFMVSAFFEDVTTFEDNIAPPALFDSNSVTDNFEIIAYPVYNNPNIIIKNDLSVTDKLGNVGWFDENYNGLDNDFTITSVSYENAAGDVVTQLDYANPIKVTAVINGVRNVTGQTKCSYGFAWIPIEETEYKQNEYPFYKNVKMNTGGDALTFQDVFNVSNAIDVTLRPGYTKDAAQMDVRNVRFQNTAANQITFEAEFVPNAAFTTQFSSLDISERNYILWISVADQTEVVNKSNRVSLLLDYSQLDTYIPPVGAYDGMTIDFLNHTQDENSIANICGDDYRIEDEILARARFTIDTATGTDIPIPTAITYGIKVERDSDGLTYLLDEYKIDLTQYPDPTQYNFNASKGFKLIQGNDKNFIKVDYYPALDSGTLKGVQGLYGFKIRWEDWLKRINVPAPIEQDFYDNTKLNNGINNDWFQWLSNTDYSMYFVVYTDAVLNGNNVRYENTKPLEFVDYDDNTNITTTLTYIRESDGTILNGGTDPISGTPLGVILDNEEVRLRIEYTKVVGTWGTLANIYGINAIEVDGGAGQLEYRQLSSIIGSESGNPLIPVTGATLLDLSLPAANILRAECLIDPNLLIDATRYKITGREGCK